MNGSDELETCIPRSFSLNNNQWFVNQAATISSTLDGAYGITNYKTREIMLSAELCRDVKEDTYYHELAHALLEETTFNTVISENMGMYYESFVQALGNQIRQYIKETA